ncbi:hypothetical protein F66182_12754 [Fusarium sp. NRRL 66182]|nr:hypothetical protein F66182_12754 [Fusarium sp. NRRL 66182]
MLEHSSRTEHGPGYGQIKPDPNNEQQHRSASTPSSTGNNVGGIAEAFDGQSQEQEVSAARRWLGGGPPPPSLPPASSISSASPGTSTKRTASGDAKFSAPPGSLPQSTSFTGPILTNPTNSESVIDTANEFTDIIDRGLIDVQTAVDAFDYYVKKIAPGLPVVVFPPGTTMASIGIANASGT